VHMALLFTTSVSLGQIPSSVIPPFNDYIY